MNRAEFYSATRQTGFLNIDLIPFRTILRSRCAQRGTARTGTQVGSSRPTYAERKGIGVTADLATTRVHNARDKTQIKLAARYNAL
jgi:hypothetical protein